ncbi:MAG: hypothetical protein ACKO4V_08865, partial [Planctomycetota bacterium]
MPKKTAIARLVIGLAACGVCAGALTGCMSRDVVDPSNRRLVPTVLTVEPSQIDLGALSQCDPPTTVAVMLRNLTRQSVTVRSA